MAKLSKKAISEAKRQIIRSDSTQEYKKQKSQIMKFNFGEGSLVELRKKVWDSQVGNLDVGTLGIVIAGPYYNDHQQRHVVDLLVGADTIAAVPSKRVVPVD